MNKDKVVGSAKTVAGAVKEATGKAFGDKKLEAKGNIEKNSGKIQSAIGNITEVVKNS